MRKKEKQKGKNKTKEAKSVGEEWRMQWLNVLHF